MKLRYYGISIIAVVTLAIVLVSCNDQWDSHYKEQTINGLVYKSDLDMYQYIKSKPELSTFTTMIEKIGYNSLLSTSQTFTVWAPNNSALAGVDLTDLAMVKKIVENHIAHFSYTTSGVTKKTMIMLNDKLFPFEAASDGYTFDGEKIIQSDLGAANGVLHILGEYVPYKDNFWEYISHTEGLDSLRNYITSLTTKELDKEKSYDSKGIFVDSVFKYPNIFLDYVAAIRKEDSIYTGILPTNAAWKEAYEKVYSCFNLLPDDKEVYSQASLAKFEIVKSLFFKGKINPTSYGERDTLYSSSLYKYIQVGNAFVNPARLFMDANKVELSNGYAYVTNKLNNTASESWNKPIKIEAEHIYYGRTANTFTVTNTSSLGTGYKTSGDYYLTAIPTKTTSLVKYYVNFPIPSTLSSTYDIYCVMVPGSIVDAADMRPYKVQFYLSYLDNQGKPITDAGIDESKTVVPTLKSSYIYTTNASKMDTVLVAKNVKFSYCNLNYDLSNLTAKPITVALKVQNAALDSEKKNFSRDLKIDYILLKPVQ